MAVFPCTDMKAIKWVRDAHHCDQYYICHFGSPLSMPACPKSQIWSNTALNCVPTGSRWDDCPTETDITPSDTTMNYSQLLKTHSNSKMSEFLKISKLEGSKDNFGFVNDDKLKVKKKRVKNVLTWHRYGNTRLPTKVPLFTQNSKTEFWVTDTKFNEKNVRDHHIKNNITIKPTSSVTPNVTKRNEKTWTKGSPWKYKTTNRIWTHHKTLTDNIVGLENLCLDNPGILIAHPYKCHWYYNCSLGNFDDTASNDDDDEDDDTDDDNFMRLRPFRVRHAGKLVWECRYPQLFDDVTNACREFINVKCGSRFEPVDQCEYSQRRCGSGRCDSCEKRFGRCRGRENGVYPIQPTQWSSVFITCYQNRNIARDRCQPPKPIFSPKLYDCVSPFEVPKIHGGLLPDCSSRPDGYYPDEQGRCAIFFRCSLGKFRGYDECPPASVFDPSIPACLPYSVASLPCGAGQAPLCVGKPDGMYADPFGRCTHFFQCARGVYQSYHSCDEGMFDPLTQSCVLSAAQTLRPCGVKPSPCETLPTGVYADQGTHCRNYIDCHQGIIITNSTCDRGLVFSAISGRCDLPQNAPPPCGTAPTCLDRRDGMYPALSRGCSFYYECNHGEFASLRRCKASDGGFFFNPATGQCDYPQNICPPCGHRWWGCARQYTI